MESPDWPEPKSDTTEFLFLYPFYNRGVNKVLRDSPQHAREMNLRRADQIASRVMDKTVRLSQIYDDNEFPAIDLEDPCQLLPALPVRMWFQSEQGISIYSTVGLRPVLEREVPSSSGWLGKLLIRAPRGESVQIDKVQLNQPGEHHGIKLGRRTEQHDAYGRMQTADSYPANAQAMYFIGMVDDYLNKLDQNRLAIVDSGSLLSNETE